MQETSETISKDPESALTPEDKQLSSMPITLPLQPTATYLAIARYPSARAYTQAPRKLLILDLNGTLLLRPKPRNARHRAIHLRPYMPSFRSYLFHEAVKPWLEVMVWSSAQPHSVDDMVTQCFGDCKEELKAVWARDTLGLDKANYSRKVQTVKDLQKRWSVPTDTMPRHSAESTLLVDDSARKAHLQPYNHLCIPEYTQNLRNKDLSIKEYIAKQEKDKEEVADQVQLAFPILTSDSIMPTKTKRKRKRLKARPVFDPTLIAMMGVLDEVKEQTNVAGWVRAGGLWAGYAPPSAHESSFELFSDEERDDRGSDHLFPSGDERRTRLKTDPVTTGRVSLINPGNDAVAGENDLTWFDHQPCFQYWVERGTRAVNNLGIDLDHGIVR